MTTGNEAETHPPTIHVALTEKQYQPAAVLKYIDEGDDLIPGMRHVSWFLSPANREAFHSDTCDLIPNNFSEVPTLMRRTTKCSLVLAAVSPPDRYGYFSLGTHADYVAALIGEAPFFVEVNHRMPRTYGENQVHIRQIIGWCEAD